MYFLSFVDRLFLGFLIYSLLHHLFPPLFRLFRLEPWGTSTPVLPGRDSGLSSRNVVSQLYIHKLKPTPQQEKTISTLYEEGHGFDNMYRCMVDVEQVEAASLLASLGLDTDTRESLANRWHVRWTNGNRRDDTHRVLYQWCAHINWH